MNFFKIFFASLLAILTTIIVLAGIFMGSIVGLIVGLSAPQSVKSESLLVIDLNEPIVDAPNFSPLSMINFQNLTLETKLTTFDMICAIESAAMDDNIKGIYIRPNANAAVSLSIIEEMRAEIERFKAQGKFVVAYSDTYSQGGYYLSSVADSLYLQCEGMVVWQGIATTNMFFKGLFDKLDLNVEVFRPTECRYKSAVEPFTRSDMSPENRVQSEALVGSLWSGIVEDVAKSRRSTPSLLNQYASELTGFIAADAQASGLVDRLVYEDEMEQVFESLGVELNSDGCANRITLSKYIASQKAFDIPVDNSNKVAVIYAEGAIIDGEGEEGYIGGDALAKVIRQARNDDDIKSVVLRVNSPGGSALASDVIWREMDLLRQEKPVVVSMGSYAASGGYYISTPADAIVADRFTITGSIGVYGVLFDTKEALSRKLGITSDGAKSNSSADFMRSSRPITPTERAIMGRSVDQVYDTFTSHVASGRNLAKSRVHYLAGGRVWSGAEAQSLGLVDMIGGVKQAILIAADMGDVSDDFQVEEMTLYSDNITSIFSPILSRLNPVSESFSTIERNLKAFETKNGVVAISAIEVWF